MVPGLPGVGTFSGDDGQPRPGTPRPRGLHSLVQAGVDGRYAAQAGQVEEAPHRPARRGDVTRIGPLDPYAAVEGLDPLVDERFDGCIASTNSAKQSSTICLPVIVTLPSPPALGLLDTVYAAPRRLDEVTAQLARRGDVIDRTDLPGPLDAVDPAELPGHLSLLLGPYGRPQLFEFRPQPGLSLITLRDPGTQVDQAPIRPSSLPRFAAETTAAAGPPPITRGSRAVRTRCDRPLRRGRRHRVGGRGCPGYVHFPGPGSLKCSARERLRTPRQSLRLCGSEINWYDDPMGEITRWCYRISPG